LKDLLRIADLTPKDLEQLLELSVECKARPDRYAGLLRGCIVAMYFAKPSTRTRFSFEAAIRRLGGIAVTAGASEMQLGRGETIEDTAAVISRYASAFVIRTFADEDVSRFASAASIPVINALTDGHHPCQSLADLMTIRERFDVLSGIRIAYLGDGNNVAHSLMEGAASAGANIALACPSGFQPDESVVARAQAIAARTGGSVALFDDPFAAVSGAHVVYTDVWLSMGTPEDERENRRKALSRYQARAALMEKARPNAIFMHCLPAHRGEEVTGEVIDGPQSVVFDQAENRMHTAQAVLVALLEGRLQREG
jgi:ornithine carbamoyltransferase